MYTQPLDTKAPPKEHDTEIPYPPPAVNRLTDTYENITFPQLLQDVTTKSHSPSLKTKDQSIPEDPLFYDHFLY